ncbi:helix-turn-helix domain-containing protein [Empedobacter brevis]|uniref:helix-turn-helix domain-containing protein n=1 Tax=Empedobacter brevis TaxID=247 RepID=UPI0028A1D1E6|nr:helix-turn-helix domain-containing protein [Empedobacter brevis]
MKKTLYSFILLCSIATAQKSDDIYEKLRNQLTTSPAEFFKNVEAAKSNALNSYNYKLVVKLDYLKGFGYYLNNHADSSVFYANSAINKANKMRYVEGEAMGLRLLGTQYAKMGLLNEAETALNKGLTLIEYVDNEETNDLKGSLYASKLVLMDDMVNLEEKLKVAKKSIHAYENLNSLKRKKEVLPLAYTNTSYMYTKLNQYDSAYSYSKKALSMVDPSDKYMNAAIYHDLGLLFLEQHQYKDAVNYLETGLKYCDSDTFLSKRQEILQRLAKAYTELGDYKKANEINEEYMELTNTINQSSKSAVRSVIHDKNSKINTLSKYEKLFNISLFLLLVFISLVGVRQYYKNRRKAKSKTIPVIQIEKEDSFSINDATKIKIIEELKKFEKEEGFVDQHMTLYHLSNKIGCNTKYLSRTVKEEFGKSFSNYINDLRIEYLLKKLETEEVLLNYKISHLSKLAGFSSDPTFIKAFQKKTGMNPSEYLKNKK